MQSFREPPAGSTFTGVFCGAVRSKLAAPNRTMTDELPFEIRPSPIQGGGAFAARRIPAGTTLIEYTGERLTPAEADA